MEFKVFINTGSEARSDDWSGKHAGYSFRDPGVLSAWDETRKVTYSPSGWLRIEESREHDYDPLHSVE